MSKEFLTEYIKQNLISGTIDTETLNSFNQVLEELNVLDIFVKHTDVKLLKSNPEAPVFIDILKSEHYQDWLEVKYFLIKKD